jgi:hypothetical protein
MRNLKSKLVASVALGALLAATAAYAGVVTRNGQGYANPSATSTNPVAVSGTFASPHAHAILSTIAVGAADSAASVYNIGNIPTNAVIDPASTVYSSSGCTGLTSVSVGFGANPQVANPLGTWAAQPTALVSAEDWHTGTSFSLVQDLSEANYLKQVWQLLGSTITLDPGGVVPVYATNNSGDSAACTLQFVLKYFVKE